MIRALALLIRRLPAVAQTALRSAYLIEAVGVVSASMLAMALPFFTHHRLGWQARDNLLLAAGQGTAYVLGALSAPAISRRWGRRRILTSSYALLVLCGVALAVAAESRTVWLLVVLVLVEMTLIATTWPMLESLVATGVDTARLSRQLGVYNLTWAVTGTITMASSGSIIEHTPAWAFFAVAAGGHLGGLLLLLIGSAMQPGAPGLASRPRASCDRESPRPQVQLEERTALWIARVSLPASYVVVYTLVPMLPSLGVVRQLPPTLGTLLASGWLGARAVAFAVSGRPGFWKRQSSLVFGAAAAMLLGFAGTVLPSAAAGPGALPSIALMLVSQVVLGFSLGVIYAASLYFGMVLGRGGPEHAGYHEALIGVGQILGPGLSAVVVWTRPGDLKASAGVVCLLIVLSLVAAAVVRLRLGRQARLELESS